MSELVLISSSDVCVNEESVFSNSLQSIFLKVLRRDKWDSGARNAKLIQRQNRTYIMHSANLENYT